MRTHKIPKRSKKNTKVKEMKPPEHMTKVYEDIKKSFHENNIDTNTAKIILWSILVDLIEQSAINRMMFCLDQTKKD